MFWRLKKSHDNKIYKKDKKSHDNKIYKKDTWHKVIQSTGGFLDVCGMLPRNLLPWLFVVGT